MGRYRRNARFVLNSDSDINLDRVTDYGLKGQYSSLKKTPVTPKGITDEEIEMTRKLIQNNRLRKKAKQENKQELKRLREKVQKGEISQAEYNETKERLIRKSIRKTPSLSQ